MNTGKIDYVNLDELSNSSYKIVEGQADITHWPVVDESGTTVGKVRDLLFDASQDAIRYIIVDLDKTVAGIEEKAVLIPIGYANLAENSKEVVVPVMSEQQYASMPRYIIGEVTRETEMKIRSAIGSPAALRIEEEIMEMDHPEFYKHHHFDRGNIISKGVGSISPETQFSAESQSREEESKRIHELIEHAHTNDPLAHEVENGKTPAEAHENFYINIDNRAFKIEPQENGIYRIFDNEVKVGAIYAQPGERGVKWATMDQLDDRFVEVLGEAITQHNAL
ncbi:PRC-barrel domain-containing protein [Pedobacter sp. WC2501]|uniref:PRC-barrel domain-containing protein n=1 Tax=Pedobacter sp. WC2501 TaxID=3461400 RepID=UPI004045C11F